MRKYHHGRLLIFGVVALFVFGFSGSVLGETAPLPPKGGLPDKNIFRPIVQQVINDNQELFQSRQEPYANPAGTWDFLEEVINKLREKDPKFAFNGKRGNLDSPSHDAISYYWGPGNVPAPDSQDVFKVYVIDISTWGKPDANWGDATDYTGCVLGAYLYPRTGVPEPEKPSKPTNCGEDPGDTIPPIPKPPILPIPNQGLPTDLGQLISAIFTWSLSIIGLVIFVRFFYAGFLWFTAAGSTTNTGQAKDIMKNAIYGTLLLFSAWLILNTINPDLVKSTLTLPGLPAGQPPAGKP